MVKAAPTKARVLVLRAAGSNCDRELKYAFELAGADGRLVHVNRLVEGSERLDDYQVLAIPGGFTYGDDVSAGKVLANELLNRLGAEIRDFLEKDRLIIGICNGFQVLVKTGILPGGAASLGTQTATLAWNDSGVFEDRWVHLKPSTGKCVFVDGEDIVEMPVAHAEGKFIPASDDVLGETESNGQVVFRYTNPDGSAPPYPANPNGSVADIAGVCDPTGRVLGLMPHPERYVLGYQGPRWTREGLKSQGDGLAIFHNALRYFR